MSDASRTGGRQTAALKLDSELVCFACGRRIANDDPHPFRCPNRRPTGDDRDHLLRRRFTSAPEGRAETMQRIFTDSEPNPFLRYRPLLHVAHRCRHIGLDAHQWAALVRSLDGAVARVDRSGFEETPFGPAPELAAALGLEPDRLLVKDETGNVSGSHKARHLMGVMLWLEAYHRRSAAGEARPRLAIASCGNAALAAAVVARAAGYPLDVFVPPQAPPAVVARLEELGAQLVRCPRRPGEAGDPCFLRFREALAGGSLPFTCQGSENGLVIDGGQTLIWEVVSQLLEEGRRMDRLYVQVGGGALASACVHGLRECLALGLLDRLPKIFAVQTAGCHPLHRAWRRLAEGIAERRTTLSQPVSRTDCELADVIAGEVSPAELGDELRAAAQHRSTYMWPWEEEPRSIASGILDDETYDWLAAAEGMLRTGGRPLVVSEETLVEAHRLARRHTSIDVEPTGTAGLAGLLADSGDASTDRLATSVLLFTGVRR